MDNTQPCTHILSLDMAKIKNKSSYVRWECEECVKINSKWVHLRICQTCGQMLCCDSSPNQHARKHFEASGHLLISSAELGENWLYCFEDESMLDF